ncbi:MAG: hypothetical protein ACRC42_02100 [Mycoplasma sp.]
MLLSEFAKERNVTANSVAKYMKRYPEYEEHIKRISKGLEIDNIGISMLDKKYPLPPPIEVREDTEARLQLIRTQQKVIELQEIINKQKTWYYLIINYISEGEYYGNIGNDRI